MLAQIQRVQQHGSQDPLPVLPAGLLELLAVAAVEGMVCIQQQT